MHKFKIHTDSACDISTELLKELDIECCPLSFKFDRDKESIYDGNMPANHFYARLASGEKATTSAVNKSRFIRSFEETLGSGNDILYLGFSSALSACYNSARLAAQELSEEYPEGRIHIVDTLSASAGQGMLIFLAARMRDRGYDAKMTEDCIRGIIPHMCHLFVVDDLTYLQRGGRIGSTTATVGNLLGVKPLLTVDNSGRLTLLSKVRGRRGALNSLADSFGALMCDATDEIFISHANCPGDADELSRIIRDRYQRSVTLITEIGSVIGSHTGQGTLALFFIGKQRPTKHKQK